MERPEPARRRGGDELAADGRFRLDRLDVVQALDVSRARSGNSRVALSLVILLLRVLLPFLRSFLFQVPSLDSADAEVLEVGFQRRRIGGRGHQHDPGLRARLQESLERQQEQVDVAPPLVHLPTNGARHSPAARTIPSPQNEHNKNNEKRKTKTNKTGALPAPRRLPSR